MTLGTSDFKFFEPWKDKPFKQASKKRGGLLYKEYCAQCHGFSGKGDGPAAGDLKPKPAIHARMALDKEPLDYLYNVIFYGGHNVGKSAMMPYWGQTLGDQGVADVIAYMRDVFKGKKTPSAGKTEPKASQALGSCPQLRTTLQAPQHFLQMKNPLEASEKNIKKGKAFFLSRAKPLACKHCHGLKGDGKGFKAVNMTPPPRNFTCKETMKSVTDGQMFWIIKKGSKDTEMQSYDKLKDKQIWQIILYIRQFTQ